MGVHPSVFTFARALHEVTTLFTHPEKIAILINFHMTCSRSGIGHVKVGPVKVGTVQVAGDWDTAGEVGDLDPLPAAAVDFGMSYARGDGGYSGGK